MAPGGGVPSGGMVTFETIKKHGKKLKVTTLGTAAVGGGDATLTVKTKSLLKKPITILYNGDTDYKASTCNPAGADATVAQEPGSADGRVARSRSSLTSTHDQ